jgi:hypothetical protein
MKVNAAIRTLVLGQLMLFSHAYAEDFCTNPLKVVCEETKQERAARDGEINRLKSEIRKEAAESAKQKIEALGTGGGVFGSVSRFFKKMKIENQEVIAAASRKLSGFEQNIVSADIIGTIKNYLKDEIDESQLSDQKKLQFKNKIEKVVVGNFSDYMEEIGASNRLLPQLFSSHCGLDGLVDNAFATKVADKDYVLICPGWLISLNKAESKRDVLNQVMQVLTHELAHHIDSRDFESEYRQMTQCIADQYGRVLNRNSRDAQKCLESDQICIDAYAKGKADAENKCQEEENQCRQSKGILCGVKAKLCRVTPTARLYARKISCEKKAGDDCRLKVAESHMGEIAADTWAAQVMGAYMKSESLNIQESTELVASNMMKLCGSQDEGIHASGDFRILETIRKNPKIVDALGCAEENSESYCRL